MNRVRQKVALYNIARITGLKDCMAGRSRNRLTVCFANVYLFFSKRDLRDVALSFKVIGNGII